jgi:hypothetical protein
MKCKGVGRKRKHCAGTCLEGRRNFARKLDENIWYLGRDSNWVAASASLLGDFMQWKETGNNKNSIHNFLSKILSSLLGILFKMACNEIMKLFLLS